MQKKFAENIFSGIGLCGPKMEKNIIFGLFCIRHVVH